MGVFGKLSSNEIDLLKQKVTCSVITQDDKEYNDQRTPWLEVVEQLPAVIVNAKSEDDIIATVRFALEKNVALSIQNTGHGIIKPCNGGILLLLSEMKNIAVNSELKTATLEPGVQSGELQSALEKFNLAFPGGQASNVGLIGYTLGGGIGWLARQFGPACNRIISAQVVLANGLIVTASSEENEDLFWALRGGGGNFGVVTSIALSTFPLNEIFGGFVYYKLQDAPEVLHFYRDWSAKLSNDTSTVLRLMQTPPTPSHWLDLLHLHGSKTCAIGICHTNSPTAEALHQEILSFKKPEIDKLKFRPYSEMAKFDEASSLKGSATYGNFECLKELSDAVLDGLCKTAQNSIPPLALIELQQFGGATKAGEDSVSYTAPIAPFALHFISPVINTSLEKLTRQTTEAYRNLGDVYTGEVSFNFLRGDQQNRLPDAFSKNNYARLQNIKYKYDPENFFSSNINIVPHKN